MEFPMIVRVSMKQRLVLKTSYNVMYFVVASGNAHCIATKCTYYCSMTMLFGLTGRKESTY